MPLFRCSIGGGSSYTKCTIIGTLTSWGAGYWSSADRAPITKTSTVTIEIDLKMVLIR